MNQKKTCKNLDRTQGFQKLTAKTPVALRDILTSRRLKECSISAGAGLTYNYGPMPADEAIITALQEIADEQGLISRYQETVNGAVMNTGEERMVLHHLTRGELGKPVIHDGDNLHDFYISQQAKAAEFAAKVHRGEISGSTGKPFTTVVQIGIGGSDLGPRALYLALETYAKTQGALKLKGEFISNVDPDDAAAVLDRVDLETTLFILVSKSGTTQETLANRELVMRRMRGETAGNGESKAPQNGAAGGPGSNTPENRVPDHNAAAGSPRIPDPSQHMIAVTSKTSPLAESSDYLESFYIDDYIGGRYSSTSAVGGVLLSLTFGPELFQELLAGAHDADKMALEPDIKKNAALMDALIGIYLRNCLGYPATALLPYSQGLHRFPAHLQQLDMESNGKQVNRDGQALTYDTGPIIFGEPGTNGQHSFYQLLHQGTAIIPLQFMGFRQSQSGQDIETDGSSSRQKLNANLAAQIIALALGKDHHNLNKQFPGERPSSLMHGEQLTPKTLGALLAHYENKVMFQGFCWNINSFDQEGVQLGKILTKQVLAQVKGTKSEPAGREEQLLAELAAILNI